jgi:hypothetical protein
VPSPRVQAYVNEVGGPDYLEIGVYRGETFGAIHANRKIAVDVEFKFPWSNDNEKGETFFQMTSDEYFSKYSTRIDGVIFVDGKHTYEQALRDIENSLRVMTRRSVLLVDDCNPSTSDEAAPNDEIIVSHGASWCGDVWKAVTHVRATRADLMVRTHPDHPGLAVITVGEPESLLDIDVRELNSWTYEDFDSARDMLLNLKSE